MSNVTRDVSRIIREGLAPTLKADGYRHVRNRFYRTPSADCVHVVEIQISRQQTGMFTMNLGVWAKPIQELRNWLPKRTMPAAHECVIRERIGRLMKAPKDVWWALGPVSDRAAVASDLLSAWTTAGAPFLDSLTDWVAVRKYLLKHDGFNAFYVHLFDRDFPKAEAIFYGEFAASPNHKYIAPRAVAAARKVGLSLTYPPHM